MIHAEIIKISKYLCAIHQNMNEEAYAQQLYMLYGALFEDERPEANVYNEIIYIENERIRRYGEFVHQRIHTPESLVMEYSQIAFYLAQRSLLDKKTFEIARLLKNLLEGLWLSDIIEVSEKKKLKSVISETNLDFIYAAGNHNVSSIRMVPIIRSL